LWESNKNIWGQRESKGVRKKRAGGKILGQVLWGKKGNRQRGEDGKSPLTGNIQKKKKINKALEGDEIEGGF